MRCPVVGAILQPVRGQQRVTRVDHRRRDIDTHVAAARRAQQVLREGRIAWADLQHLLAGSDREQGDGGTVELAIAVVHRFGHGKRMLAMGGAQLGGQIIGGKHAQGSCRWAAGPGGGGVHRPA